MDQEQGSFILREQMRLLVRKLGLLQKGETSCYGVSLSQCHAIVEIGRKEEVALHELAGILGLDKSTMSRTVQHLVHKEFVLRSTDLSNRRSVKIKLSESGCKMFQEIEEGMKLYYSSIFSNLPIEKKSQVLESMDLLLKAMQQEEIS
jgi:DNA-binding MarR family transcriptional regulator